MNSKITDYIIEKIIFLCGIIAIVFVVLIFGFLLKEGFAFFKEYGVFNFIFGKYWYPSSNPASYGVFSLIIGSLLVTCGAAILAVPFGIMTASSVVLGFVGMVTLVPLVRSVLDIPTGLTAFSGSIVLGFMAMPTIVSISEDAIRSVPWQYKEGAFALGATKWQTIRRVVLKAAMPGIIAAVMLGIGRVIGETMAVLMVTGNAAAIPSSIFDPVRTLTATIAAEMGETVRGGLHYRALFGIGLVLFTITFLINFIADLFLNKKK